MKKNLLVLLICFGFLISGSAQTSIWQESFDPAPQAGWSIDVPFGSNGANHSLWVVNGTEGGSPVNSCCWTAGNNALFIEIKEVIVVLSHVYFT